MADKKKLKNKAKIQRRRRFRIRKIVAGTADRPRMVVHRSLRNIEVQIIDDEIGHSLIGLSTLSKEVGSDFDNRVEQGHTLGKLVAEKAKKKGIQKVVFDRAGLLYHGIVKAVADGAREGGLNF